MKVFDGTDFSLIGSFNAFDPAFPGGVFVAAADFNGDGHAEIVTTPVANGGPAVRVYDGATVEGATVATGATMLFPQFFAYATSMNAGVRLALADVNGDGTPDIITAPGKNFASLVKVFDGTSLAKIAEFHAFDPAFLGGVFLAAGEINGDGKAEIIAGAGPGGGPAVRVYDGASASLTGATMLSQFFAYALGMTGGVRVGAVDADADGRTDILTAPGGGFPSHVKAFDGDDLTGGTVLYDFFAYDTSFTGGAFVSGNGANFEEVFYTWDHRNRLTAVAERNANGRTMKEVEYTYDVFDRRIAKDVDDDGNGTIDRGEQYVYDGEDIALVFDGAGSLKNRYLHGPGIDEVFADEDALGEILWALGDNQGTVRDWARSDGTIANHVTYDAFGKITGQTSATHEPLYAYTGREWDADAGMYYYRARWYDAEVGRFASEDPIAFESGDANLARYVGNSSPNATDPSGLMPPNMITWHHLFPQGKEFAKYLAANGIDPSFLHSAENGWYILGEDHTQLHENCPGGHNWNRDWAEWINQNKTATLDQIKKRIEDMKRQYGLISEQGAPLRGAPVGDVDGMPYDTWKKGPEARSSWRERTSTQRWQPSREELRRNKADAKVRQDAKMSRSRGGANSDSSSSGKNKPGAGRAARTFQKLNCFLGGLGILFDVLDLYDLKRRADENNRSMEEQNRIDGDTSPFLPTPLPMPNPFFGPRPGREYKPWEEGKFII